MWHTMTSEEIRKKLKTNFEYGLTEQEAKKRQKDYGENKLEKKKKTNIFVKFIKQFQDFMIIVLLIAAVISAVMSYLEGTGEYIDSIIIVTIVFFNAIMGLIQENKAEKALEALAELSAPVAKVKRNGKVKEVLSTKLVPGDIIQLETGCFVPADCRILTATTLEIEESALTGETIPVTKEPIDMTNNKAQTGDISNMAFATTIITKGHGQAVVCDIGMNTKVGKIAKLILSDESPDTPLQKKLGEVGKKLGIVALGICIIIFIIGILKKIQWVQMFMTSVGLAVAAIPEGLPAIVTILLSIGVTKMAKKKSIIRKLPAVETLGSSQVICSDKTGTLTQNKMKVMVLNDASGNISNKTTNTNRFLLELATLCNDSTLQKEAGKWQVLGEPTENAIINAAVENKIYKMELEEKFPRNFEIPFESSRKLMTTIHKLDNGYRIITKGAPDILIKRCEKYYYNGKTEIMDTYKTNQIQLTNQKLAEKAMRLIAVAYLDVMQLPSKITSEQIEKNLVFVRANWND